MYKHLKVLLNYDEFTVMNEDTVIAKTGDKPRRASSSIDTNFQDIMTGKQQKRVAITRWYHHNINNMEDLDV